MCSEPGAVLQVLACQSGRRRGASFRGVCVTALGLAIAIASGLASDARGDIIFDSGDTAFVANGTQFGRLSRDGTPSTWAAVKAFPGVTGAPTPRAFEQFVVNSGASPFLQITLNDPNNRFLSAAYLNSFLPVNSPPNFGLDTNYLGDPGTTQVVSVFQIVVAPGTQIVVPITEVTPGTGAREPLRLLVEGFASVPEPHSLALLATGALALLIPRALRGRKLPRT